MPYASEKWILKHCSKEYFRKQWNEGTSIPDDKSCSWVWHPILKMKKRPILYKISPSVLKSLLGRDLRESDKKALKKFGISDSVTPFEYEFMAKK